MVSRGACSLLVGLGGYCLQRFGEKPLQTPRFARNPSRHGGRRLQRHVLEAEFVEREPKSGHRLVIRHRLGMGIGQPRESSDVRSAGQAEPLHAAGAYLGSLDVAADLFRFHSHYSSRVILLLLLLGRGDERLHYLGEVDFAIPRLRDDRRVGCKPVSKRSSGVR